MATKKKAAKKQPATKAKSAAVKSATPAKAKVKQKAEAKNEKEKPVVNAGKPAKKKAAKKKKKKPMKAQTTTTLSSSAETTTSNTAPQEETITVDSSLQAENNSSATAQPPVLPEKKSQPATHKHPNSLAIEVEKFGKTVEGIITDHVGRLPMSEKEAVAFIKSSNTKCRVEVTDVDVVVDEKTGKTEKQQIINVFLGNEKYEFKPLKLQ